MRQRGSDAVAEAVARAVAERIGAHQPGLRLRVAPVGTPLRTRSGRGVDSMKLRAVDGAAEKSKVSGEADQPALGLARPCLRGRVSEGRFGGKEQVSFQWSGRSAARRLPERVLDVVHEGREEV